jgi:Heterokaryon incompatibility protein (HET)
MLEPGCVTTHLKNRQQVGCAVAFASSSGFRLVLTFLSFNAQKCYSLRCGSRCTLSHNYLKQDLTERSTTSQPRFNHDAMRLINTKTLQLEEDHSGESLRYAILSHRWQAKEEEVTFQDLQETKQSQAERGVYKKKGFYKIRKACEKAADENLTHLWVDTCCIDKSSSTELNEAINSMYRWYSEATVCFAYLFDVDDPEEGKVFEKSDWFKRGWTLQELLAPKKVTFFNGKWQRLGDKSTLSGKIATASNISVDVLETPSRINERSIAERMSWASDRSTTRTEDMAYSLLGIFGIHMPLIYGENENAFIRLQEEIIKKSSDQSIFAWSGVEADHPGLLARSPKAFKESENIREVADISSFSVGKKGIEMTARMRLHSAYTYLAQLSCAKEPGHEMVGVFLRQLPGSKDYVRIKAEEKDWVEIKKEDQLSFPIVERIMVCQRPDPGPREDSYLIQPDFRIRVSGNAREQSFTPIPEGSTKWDETEQVFVLSNGKVNSSGMIGALKFRSSDAGIQVIRLGFDGYSNPVCVVAKWYAVKSSVS